MRHRKAYNPKPIVRVKCFELKNGEMQSTSDLNKLVEIASSKNMVIKLRNWIKEREAVK